MSLGETGSARPGDSRFFRRTGPHSLASVVDAALVDGQGAEAPPRRLMLHGVAPLTTATDRDVSYCLNNRKYQPALLATRAGAVVVHPDMRDQVPNAAVAIVAHDPLTAWSKIVALFHPLPPTTPGVHKSAIVSASARIDPTAEVGPLAVIGDNVTIGPRGRIGPAVVIGDNVQIGGDVRIGSHASVSHALIGDRVYIYPGARIGQEGFGFAVTPDGFQTVPQVGRVIIENDVEVGANCTIDRGALEDTVIGAGTRIDNLVQIAHNVRIGRACIIVSQAGISGSTVLEDQVVLAGQVGLAGHLRIGHGARIGAQAGVMGNVAPRAEVLGTPAQPAKSFWKEVVILRRWVRDGGRAARKAEHDAKSTQDAD
jgi:UDP-3-O-[3-hydroxymyristoyl] glucosamine N-acyltransferase